ncbi:hypothetical protein BC829DRAFT_400082, partial [Chytridium lagenaria]
MRWNAVNPSQLHDLNECVRIREKRKIIRELTDLIWHEGSEIDRCWGEKGWSDPSDSPAVTLKKETDNLGPQPVVRAAPFLAQKSTRPVRSSSLLNEYNVTSLSSAAGSTSSLLNKNSNISILSFKAAPLTGYFTPHVPSTIPCPDSNAKVKT